MSEIFKKQKIISEVKSESYSLHHFTSGFVFSQGFTHNKKMKAATLKYSGHLQNCPTWQRCASDMSNQTCNTDQTITAPPGKSC